MIEKNIALKSLNDSIEIFKAQYKDFIKNTNQQINILAINISELIKFEINHDLLRDKYNIIETDITSIKAVQDKNKTIIEDLNNQRTNLELTLNDPQLSYQKYLKDLDLWEKKLNELVGKPHTPATQKGLEERISQLEKLPEILRNKQNQRIGLVENIFDVLCKQRTLREGLFLPVQELIQNNTLIGDDYKLQFKANLIGSFNDFSNDFFSMVKKTTGDLRGEEDSIDKIKSIFDKYDFNEKNQVVLFVNEINDLLIKTSARPSQTTNQIGIKPVLKQNTTSKTLYDFLYGLSYIEPNYSLLFQNATIQQLSPGQRGALLLVFYLLVDKGLMPIVLDQPEENLDNESIVGFLVPVLTEAKKKRQIIMVTHNPNLAVVCDSEQVIYSSFDRKNGSNIQYLSGSIENSNINKYIVNVLEGTKIAFNNRRFKYH